MKRILKVLLCMAVVLMIGRGAGVVPLQIAVERSMPASVRGTTLQIHSEQAAPETVLVVDFHGFLFNLDISRKGFQQMLSGAVPALKNGFKQLFAYPLDVQRWKAAAVPVHPQKPVRAVIAALRAAQRAGCRIVLFSNITPQEYAVRVQEYPDLKLSELFDEEVRLSELCTHTNGHLVSKRDPKFHRACVDLIMQRYGKAQVTFFDDRQQNLDYFQRACRTRGLTCYIRLAQSPEQSVRDIRAVVAARKRR